MSSKKAKATQQELLALKRKNKLLEFWTVYDKNKISKVEGTEIVGIKPDMRLDKNATNVTQSKALFLLSPGNAVVPREFANHIRSKPILCHPHVAGKFIYIIINIIFANFLF